jgi:hypothetical protein
VPELHPTCPSLACREEGLSFSNVVTFNLDEYWPMEPGALQVVPAVLPQRHGPEGPHCVRRAACAAESEAMPLQASPGGCWACGLARIRARQLCGSALGPLSKSRSPRVPQSYHRFMREHLFDHVDVPAEAVHIPDGTVPLADVPR